MSEIDDARYSELVSAVEESEETEMAVAELIDAIEWLVSAFCPGDDWAEVPVRKAADDAVRSGLRLCPQLLSEAD